MRHKWDGPADTFERTCHRCRAVIRKFVGQGGYWYQPPGCDKWQSGLMTIPPCEGVPRSERFHGRVRINYSLNNPVVPYRHG